MMSVLASMLGLSTLLLFLYFVRTVELYRIVRTYDLDNTAQLQTTARSALGRKLKYLLAYRYEKSISAYKNAISEKQTLFTALQRQINPHFLYNTLECIRSEAMLGGQREIADMTENLANFFRYSISSKGNVVTIADELENVHNYFKIQQFRFGNKFELRVDCGTDEDVLYTCRIPKLTLQPLIENAIHHGLESKQGVGHITIRFILTNARLLIRICDDGVGIEQAKLDVLNSNLDHCMDDEPTA